MTTLSKSISKAIKILKNEELVAIPTETVYGLAGNIFSEKAIKKIFETKQRPLFNPLIVHISSKEKLETIASHIPHKAKLLSDAFWPGPLTLILPKQSIIPDLITAGKDTVAVRVPNHPLTLELLNKLEFPLAAPSANPFGHISPTKAIHVKNYFKDVLQLVLDGGSCKKGIESTIVGFESNEPVIYRLGSISIENIESIVGKVQLKNKKESSPEAPGMLSRHYAPNTQTFLVDNVADFVKKYPSKKIGVLLFKKRLSLNKEIHQEVLSIKGDLEEAASKLYKTLHNLDSIQLDIIVCERFPNHDLGTSINDRLERATKS